MPKKALLSPSAAPRAARPAAGTAEPLQTVAICVTAMEAHMARARLEDAGIVAFLSNEYIALVDSPIAASTGGVQVRVRQSDAPRAVEVLRTPHDPSG